MSNELVFIKDLLFYPFPPSLRCIASSAEASHETIRLWFYSMNAFAFALSVFNFVLALKHFCYSNRFIPLDGIHVR